MQTLLLLNCRPEFLLRYIASPLSAAGLRVYTTAQVNRETKRQLHQTIIWMAWQQGYYQSHSHLPMTYLPLPETGLADQITGQQVWLDGEPDERLSDLGLSSASILPTGQGPSQDFDATALDDFAYQAAQAWLSRHRHTATAHLSSLDEPAPAWGQHADGKVSAPALVARILGQDLAYAFDLELWRDGLGIPQRTWFNGLIAEALAQADANWHAQLILLLYKRELDGLHDRLAQAPAWFRDCYAELRPRLGKVLQILAPVDDLTVTITIPTFNRCGLLKHAVQSVRDQTYPHWKLIIADDGSTDGTEAYGRALAAQDARISYFKKAQNSGYIDTFQQVMARVETELVIPFADDDVMYAHNLDFNIAYLKQYPWLACVGGGYHTHLQCGPYSPVDTVPDPSIELQRCCYISPFSSLGTVQRKSVIEALHSYDPWARQHDVPYVLSDYLEFCKTIACYEVGITNQIMGYHDISELSGQRTRDDTDMFVALFMELCKDYNELFGEDSLPYEAGRYFLEERTFRTYLWPNFAKQFDKLSSCEEIEAYCAQKRSNWLGFYQARQLLLKHSDKTQPSLFDHDGSLGPTQGKFTYPEVLSYERARSRQT